MKAIPVRSGKEKDSTLVTFIKHSLENLGTIIRQEKEKKNPNWKGRSKMWLVADNMIF